MDGATDQIDRVVSAFRDADSAIALTGAGVSTASGIPSFRGDDGIWERFDPMEFHRRRFDADPAGFWEDRCALREEVYGDVEPEPNVAHEALAALVESDFLDAVITQNIDGLHDDAGTDDVIELHGNHHRAVCDDCGERLPAESVFERAANGELPPHCDCGGVYKPDVVLFGEALPDEALEEAQRLARESDVLLAVGTSLSVKPASLLLRIATDAGGTVVVINLDSTAFDSDAEHVLRCDVTAVLPAIASQIGIDRD